ncbi:nuclear transport factor 2 family protein [Photobacterium iliopiscarium]|jgi:hypothetical protein|uniref:Nuclear transport factor 2 family protein n=1 Tax=Photobacterium iliopiscarium TaxID=56192 RepID=A0A2T3M9I5_9GAMM|nr:nuclear transport factor 2 family protein [Photobacterium iliopiscarium]PSV89375.1 nuclear transport factor 2 family protein [Photobacterium iliopiscarium]
MKTFCVLLLAGLMITNTANADEQTEQTMSIAQSFLEAAGSGDATKLGELMSDDFVWHNEGDTNVPWIGNWVGRETVLNEFLPAFAAGLKVTSWTIDYSFVNGNQAVFIGSMSAITTHSGIDTGSFSWAVRVHVEDRKVKSWNWFEDGYALSKAYNSKQ